MIGFAAQSILEPRQSPEISPFAKLQHVSMLGEGCGQILLPTVEPPALQPQLHPPLSYFG